MQQPQARDENLRESWGCTPKPVSLTQPLTPSVRAADLSQFPSDEAALAHLAGKLGVTILPSRGTTSRRASRQASLVPEDDSFIRTPPTNPQGSPELSPPPSYDSLAGLPDVPTAGFSLPPPAAALPVSGLDPKDSKTVILYVGRISWEKNLRLLIEAFKQLPAGVRASAKLVFVGDGPARGDLTRLCAKHGLDASFMGHQKGKRLAAMFASASVFAFPSFTETFGQVVLEALASGLPVVGLHAEGTSDLVSHGRTGLLLDINAVAREPSAAARPSGPVRSSSALEFARVASTLPPHSPSKSTPTSVTTGLASPIPTVTDFAAAMTPNSTWFHQSAKAYSMLLERLILDRQSRALMGQRAVAYASQKTWWDAMDAPVRGYEQVIARAGHSNLTDEELEAWRSRQQRKAPLTGPAVKALVVLYVLLFAYFATQHLLK